MSNYMEIKQLILMGLGFLFVMSLYWYLFHSNFSKDKKSPFDIRQTVALVSLCLIVSLFSIALYDTFFATKIVKIDTTPFIKGLQKEFIEGKLTEKELDEKLLSLKSVIHSQSANKVILMSDMVVSQNVETIKP